MKDDAGNPAARPAPARFAEILGHEAPIALLRRAIDAGRLPHALIFQGPEGVGKGTVARLLAAALLCERDGERPCGSCLACRKVAHESHPDLMLLGREPRKSADATAEPDAGDEGEGDGGPEASRVLRVAQIRQLAAHAAYAPQEGQARVFVIEPADRMNVSAQNALLKTLEEPPGRAVLILVTGRPQVLLSTVRSRCLAVRFAAMPVSDLADRLAAAGLPRAEALARAALAGGRAGLALRLDLEAVRGRREQVLDALERLARDPRALADLPAMSAALAGEGDEASLLEALDLVVSLLRDAAVSAAGLPATFLVHADLAPRLAEIGRRLGRSRAARLVRGVERLRGDLRFNPNEKILADCVWAAVAGGPVP